MKSKIVHTLLTVCLLSISQILSAQNKGIEIKGRVVDGNTDQGIQYATVMLGNKDDEKVIAGATTDENGNFSIRANSENVYIDITFLGFIDQRIEKFTVENGKVDIGTIRLEEKVETLDEVVIEGEKSRTEFKLDKRVFNVGSDLSSAGGSALDVLSNVPSVNVSIEGDISLRGSTGVQVLINGKPSVLTSEQGNALGTITADMIEKVEVITNPSAKYDAEGTSGIINIVIKKEERKGINGSVTLNTGVPHNHSVGLSLNRRTEKFNLFTQLGVGYRESPNDSRNINRDLVTGTTIFSNGEEFRNETFYNVILGTDYHINKNNVLTLSGYFAYEIEDQPSTTNFELEDADGVINSRWRREENTKAFNPKYQYEFQYKKDFEDDEDHDLLISALGNFFGKSQNSDFINTTLSGERIGSQEQETATDFQEAIYTFKLDYTKPFKEVFTIETGAQYVIDDVSNDFEVADLVGGDFVTDPTQTNRFEWDQRVLGLYGTTAYEGKKWGMKLGLRLENTDLGTLLAVTDEANDQNYSNFFPSAHTSYKVSETFSMQAGYSRRIRRPRLWDLNPFFNIRNNFAIRRGNPDLQPEFTDSYEISSILIIPKLSTNFSIYQRYTTDVVERVTFFQDSVSITQPLNIGTNRATGLEINAKYTPSKWLTITGDLNFNYFNQEGEFEFLNREGVMDTTIFDFDANQWNGEVRSKFKLPADIDIELSGEFQSRLRTVQGTRSAVLFADLGVRKKIMKGRGVINLSIRDIFASRIWESEANQPDFYTFSRRLRGRFITIGFSYGFGKGEAMEFSGARRRW